MLRRCTARSFHCSDIIGRVIRMQQSTLAYSTQISVTKLSGCSCITSQPFPHCRFLLQREPQRRHISRYTLSQHSFVRGTTNASFRYQTTTTSKSDYSTTKVENKKELTEEERLLENIEEIVDIPASALEEVIDRSKYTNPIPIPMPDLGTSNGNSPDRYSLVKEWFFQKGDIIQHEDVLCDIQTPDFTFGMETDDEGITIMGDILVPAGQPVPDGTVLCYTFHESNGNDHPNPPSAEHSKLDNDDDDDKDDDDEKDKEEADDKKDGKSESEKNKP
jgi:Biotin-requiring enzyme